MFSLCVVYLHCRMDWSEVSRFMSQRILIKRNLRPGSCRKLNCFRMIRRNRLLLQSERTMLKIVEIQFRWNFIYSSFIYLFLHSVTSGVGQSWPTHTTREFVPYMYVNLSEIRNQSKDIIKVLFVFGFLKFPKPQPAYGHVLHDDPPCKFDALAFKIHFTLQLVLL